MVEMMKKISSWVSDRVLDNKMPLTWISSISCLKGGLLWNLWMSINRGWEKRGVSCSYEYTLASLALHMFSLSFSYLICVFVLEGWSRRCWVEILWLRGIREYIVWFHSQVWLLIFKKKISFIITQNERTLFDFSRDKIWMWGWLWVLFKDSAKLAPGWAYSLHRCWEYVSSPQLGPLSEDALMGYLFMLFI